MPFYTSILPHFGATIVMWRHTETTAELLSLLPELVRAELLAMNLSEKRLGERAITQLLLESLPETRGAQLGYTPEGAPRLLNRPGYISISHTRGWVAVAYHPTQPIGVDIERKGMQVVKVAPRVLNKVELNALLDSPLRNEWLHLCWSAKEALFKAIPESEIDFRKQLHITPAEPMQEGCLVAIETRTEACRAYSLWYRVSDDFVIVCAASTTPRL